MQIPLHNGPHAKTFYEVDDDVIPPNHIMYVFSKDVNLLDDIEVLLQAHVYSLQSLRGSMTTRAYVYTGIQPIGVARIGEEKNDETQYFIVDQDVSDIVSYDGVEIETPKRPRGRPRKTAMVVEA